MRFYFVVLTSVCTLLGLSATACKADTKVEVKGVHLCCGACVNAVNKVLKDAGVEGKSDRASGTVTFTASDEQAAQKVLNALAEAGFHGDTGSKTLAIKEDSGATAGKVKTVTITGVHNCCQSCCRGIKATLKKVDGVTGDTAKPKVTTFEVTGDFDTAELIKALNAAGFHAKVEKK